MTFRSRPASRRADRSRDGGRRTLYLNIFFTVVVAAAVLILAAAAGASWYGQHLAPVGSVDGAGISKDALSDRYAIIIWRLNQIESRVRDEVQRGTLTKAQGDQQLAFINQQRSNTQSLIANALESLIDGQLEAKLAAKMGITVTTDQVNARLLDEATTKEQRHVWVIAVKPDVTAPATTPTDAQKAAALAKANGYLADLRGGKSWQDVAKAAAATNDGDLGFLQVSTTQLESAFATTLFAAQLNTPTEVSVGTDGTARIGRVTEVIPQSVDAQYEQKLTAAHVSVDAYKQGLREQVVRDALQAKVIADATQTPGIERRVSEIFINVDIDPTTKRPVLGDMVKVRHVLYAAGNPQVSPAPSNDPAWAQAQAKAQATYDLLLKDPSKFAAIAKKDSADTSSAVNGGDLDYTLENQFDPAFGKAVFAPGLKKDQLLPPVKSIYGWHVIQFIDRKQPANTRLQGFTLQLATGADFATLAKANSQAPEASNGGDIGWVARNQLSADLEKAIFTPKVGGISDVVVSGAGAYLFKIVDEQTRKPDGAQLDALKSSAFTNWYADQKSQATITRDPAYTQTTGTTGG